MKTLTSSSMTHWNGYWRIEKIESGLKPLDVVVVVAAITRLSQPASSRDGRAERRAS